MLVYPMQGPKFDPQDWKGRSRKNENIHMVSMYICVHAYSSLLPGEFATHQMDSVHPSNSLKQNLKEAESTCVGNLTTKRLGRLRMLCVLL